MVSGLSQMMNHVVESCLLTRLADDYILLTIMQSSDYEM